jgi:folate-dependent phosphoribosylglycinamide formyltransferase PurN
VNQQSDTAARQQRKGSANLKILFLGNTFNSLSVTCLLALVDSRQEVWVAEYNPTNKGPIRTIKESLHTFGLRFVVAKAVEYLWSVSTLILSRFGFRLGDHASLPAVALAHRLQLRQVTNPNAHEFLEYVKSLNPDLIVVAGFSRILKRVLISLPRLGCINVHPSLLPCYRGPEPYYWILFHKEQKSGVTIHYVDEGIDSGNIIVQREISLEPYETEYTLQQKSNALAAVLLTQAIEQLAKGAAASVPQSEAEATYFSFPPRGAKRNFRAHLPVRKTGIPTNASL